MKTKLFILLLACLFTQGLHGQNAEFVATKIGFCYDKGVPYGWSGWSVYEQKIRIKVIITPFQLDIQNSKHELYHLNTIQNQFNGMDLATGYTFHATAYLATDKYNQPATIIIFSYSNNTYSIQIEYSDYKYFYTNELKE